MRELVENLKAEIIDSLNLEGVEPSEIDETEPLFDSDLGLDSIDALELIVLLEKNYGLKIANPEDGKKIFYSVSTIADYIESNRK